jgi:hypothetical protein
MYIIANVSLAMLQTFGTQKLVNVNGVHKLSYTKNRAVDVYAHQILHFYFKIIAYPVIRQNIGTTRQKDVNIVQILLFITA